MILKKLLLFIAALSCAFSATQVYSVTAKHTDILLKPKTNSQIKHALSGAGEISPPLKVCVLNWPVYSFKDSQGKAQGIVVDLIEGIAARAGRAVEFTFMAINRCSREVANNRFDIIPYASKKGSLLLSANPIQFYIAGFAVLQDSPHKSFHNFSQFQEQTVGVLQGGQMYKALDKDENIDVIHLTSANSQLRMISNQRLDATSADLVSLSDMDSYKNKELRFLFPPLNVVPLYFGFAPKNGELKALFNQGINRAIENGDIDQLYKTHSPIPFQRISDIVDDYKKKNSFGN